MYIFVYRLWLEEGSIYIGMTTNPTRRLRDHKRGIGSIHTMGKPIMTMDYIWQGEVKNKYQALLIENSQARRWREKMKGNNVYGGELSKRYKKICIRKAFAK